MRIKHKETYLRMLRWMIAQHDAGVDWIDTQSIYEWWNSATRNGVVMQQLTNYLGKGKEIDKHPDGVMIPHPLYLGGSYRVCLWRVHPHYMDRYRAKRETHKDEL